MTATSDAFKDIVPLPLPPSPVLVPLFMMFALSAAFPGRLAVGFNPILGQRSQDCLPDHQRPSRDGREGPLVSEGFRKAALPHSCRALGQPPLLLACDFAPPTPQTGSPGLTPRSVLNPANRRTRVKSRPAAS